MPAVATRWLVVLVVALGVGPLVTLTVDEQPVVVSAIDLAAVGLAVHGVVDARRRGWRPPPALVPFAALVALLLAQLVLGDDRVAVVGGISRFVTAGSVLLGLGQLASRTDDGVDPQLPWLTWPRVVVVGGAVLGALAVADWVRAVRDPALVSFYAVKNAVVLPLGASNYLAAFLVVALLVGIGWARHDRALLLPTGVVAAGLLATMSRAGLVAVGAVVLGRAAGRRLGSRVGMLIGLALGAGVVGVLVVANLEVGGATPGALRTPADDRMTLFGDAVRAFVADPVLGAGINGFDRVTDLDHDHAHNLVLHGLATTGLLGTLAYLGVWATLGLRLLRAPAGPTRSALRLAAGGLFLHAQLEALSHTRAVEVVVAVLLVLAATLDRRGGEPALDASAAERGREHAPPYAPGFVAAWSAPWTSPRSWSWTSARSTPS